MMRLASLVTITATIGSVGAIENTAPVSSGSAFNPQISLILQGNYYHDNQKGLGQEMIAEAAGAFHNIHVDEHAHDQQGFNVHESELMLSATIDPNFDGRVVAAMSVQNSIEIEEAWIKTRTLPYGLTFKVGKILSEFGYQNGFHAHAWDFSDQNLAYLSLLGDHGLTDTGAQLTWLAPTPFYSLWGVELLQGNDQERFGTVWGKDNADVVAQWSAANLSEKKSGPRIQTAFVKFAPNLGDNHALQWGLSYAHAAQYQQVLLEEDAKIAQEGTQNLWATDVVYKYDATGQYGAGDVKFVAEYLRVANKGHITAAENADFMVGDSITAKQDGYYAQVTYGFAPRWQVGARYEATGSQNVAIDGAELDTSNRSSLSVSFYPSEFSRIRLQYADAKIASEEGDKESIQQVMLSYNLSLGTHGAHKF